MSERITADGNIDSNWYDANATFYGDMTGSETMRKYNYIVIAKDGGTIEFCLTLISENKKKSLIFSFFYYHIIITLLNCYSLNQGRS